MCRRSPIAVCVVAGLVAATAATVFGRVALPQNPTEAPLGVGEAARLLDVVLRYWFDYNGNSVGTVVRLTPSGDRLAAEFDVADGAFVMSATGVRAAAQGPAPLSPTDAPIVLFDGKSLDKFYTWVRDTRREDPRRIFNVAMDNGQPVIHITGDGYGGLITKDEYTNYHLIAEYRWGERTWGDRLESARDSGILIHGIGPDGGSTVQRVDGVSPWLTSIEFQIIEGGVGDFLVLAGNDANEQPLELGATVEIEMRPVTTARGQTEQAYWKMGGEARRFTRGRVNWKDKDPNLRSGKGTRGANDVDTPGRGWTRLECIADGDRLTYLVNGVVVMEASNVTPTAGKLQFQTEQAEIYFRKIELHPLGRRAMGQ